MLFDLTLHGCAKKCSEDSDNVNCHHFEYNAQRQTCALKAKSAQPVGHAVLMPASAGGQALFQQICIPTKSLCAAPYSFERYPQKVLSGHAMEVINVDGLSSCLLECLEARKKMHLDCRSVMYYYETGQCILNREQRKTAPHMFTSDTKFQLVDYFENNCFDVSCDEGFNVHWIRMDDYEIGQDKDVIMTGLSAEECKKACTNNLVGTEVFPCKAYVYTPSKGECRMSAESGMIVGHKKAQTGTLISELSSISAGQYSEKFCLQGPVKCKETSFDMIPNRMLDVRDKVISTSSLSKCLFECLQLAEECNSVMFIKDRDECVLNKKSQFSNPDLFKAADRIDYFDNNCDYEVRPVKKTETKLRPMFKPDMEMSDEKGIDQNLKAQNDVSSDDTTTEMTSMATTSTTVKVQKGLIETECKLDGIYINAQFDEPTSGSIFIKDHSSTCRRAFENTVAAKLTIPHPKDRDDDCPGTELAPNLWSFIVVVQKNSINSAVMTGIDRIFNVTCDYSNVKQEKEISPQNDAPSNQLEMFTNSVDKPTDKVQMAILRNGVSVSTVSLGEELELRWIVSESAKHGVDDEPLGFLVEECTAERMDGVPPEPAPLKLIEGGCPSKKVENQLIKGFVEERSDGFSAKLKVFRFDGSRRVRIRCAINICIERCEPAVCEGLSSNSSRSLSFGRRKRQTINELANLLEQYDQLRGEGKKMLQGEMIDQSTAQGTFTIVDKPTLTSTSSATVPPFIIGTSTSIKMSSEKTDSIGEANELNTQMECEEDTSKLCIRRPLAILILVALAILIASQLFWALSWLQNRRNEGSSDGRSTSTSISSTASTLSGYSDNVRWEYDKSSMVEWNKSRHSQRR